MFCTTIGTETQGTSAKAPCQNALIATSEQSKLSQTMNELESYSQHFVYKNVNDEVIKVSIFAGYLFNSYNEKMVRAQLPFKPFELDMNLGLLVQNYGVKYTYDW